MMLRTTTVAPTRNVRAAPRAPRPTVARPSVIVRGANDSTGQTVPGAKTTHTEEASYKKQDVQEQSQQASDGQQFPGKEGSQQAFGEEGRRDQVGQGGERGLGQSKGQGAGQGGQGQEDATQQTLLTHPETFAPEQEGGWVPSMMDGQEKESEDPQGRAK